MTINEIIERAFPCSWSCAQTSDWPIDSHVMQCPAYHREPCRRAMREVLSEIEDETDAFLQDYIRHPQAQAAIHRFKKYLEAVAATLEDKS